MRRVWPDRPDDVPGGLEPALPAGGVQQLPPPLILGPADAMPGAAVDEPDARRVFVGERRGGGGHWPPICRQSEWRTASIRTISLSRMILRKLSRVRLTAWKAFRCG